MKLHWFKWVHPTRKTKWIGYQKHSHMNIQTRHTLEREGYTLAEEIHIDSIVLTLL